MDASEVEQLVRGRFAQNQKTSSARYFLVNVERVAVGKQNQDNFKVWGTRVDTGQQVTVISNKSTSGQAMPEVGGTLRADKVQQTRVDESGTHYTAQYFHSYGTEDFCLAGTVQAQPPKQNPGNNMWSASLRVIDHKINYVAEHGDKFNNEDLVKILLPMLKPWESKQQSSITHDVKGAPIWGTPRMGINPLAAVKLAGKTMMVFGIGAVAEGDKLRFPTDKEIAAKIKSAPALQNALTALQGVPAEALAQLTMVVLPGITANIGRDSLAGASQKYLAVPEAFKVINQSKLDEHGKPTTYPGWRENTYVHMKVTRSGRLAVVDAAPGSSGSQALHSGIPETEVETQLRLELAKAKAAGNAPVPSQSVAGGSAPNAAKPNAQAARRSDSAPIAPQAQPQAAQNTASAPRPAPNEEDFDDDFQSTDASMDDWAEYANDLEAMESMNQGMPSSDDDFDDVLAQAEARQTARRAAPRM